MSEQGHLLSNIGTLYQCSPPGGQSETHAVSHAALVWQGGKILWAGGERDLPQSYRQFTSWDAQGRIVVPGLIDCHTHLAFGGWRQDEFVQRLLGASYLDILAKGGGILNTVRHTRGAPQQDLVDRCYGFLSEMSALGVTTVECKSGYGLTTDDEIKLLRVYQILAETQPVSIVPTLLAAHTFPAEFSDNKDGYVDLICNEIIPRVAKEKLAQFCDAYVEQSVFSTAQAERIFTAAKAHGLRTKIHADQLSDQGGAALAARIGAISADHLECVNDAGIKTLGGAGVISVLLPLASLYLRQQPVDGRRFVELNAPVAIATDFNPGSAPSYHLPLAMMLACTLNRLTPAEVLKGVTYFAACALNLQDRLGSIESGKQADFCVIDADDVNQWLYNFRPNACVMTVKGGKKIFDTAN